MTPIGADVRQAVAERLRAHGHEAVFVEIGGDGRRSTDAAREAGVDLETVTKCLALVADDGRLIAAVLLGSDRADMNTIKKTIAARAIRFATPSEMRERTGFNPGGVPILLLDDFARVLVDAKVFDQDHVWASGGDSRTGVSVPTRLLTQLGYETADLAQVR